MNKNKQYLLYLFFAILSTLINIGIQKEMEIFFGKIILWNFYNEIFPIFTNITNGLIIQMSIATVIAFVFKYIVDKIIIFKDKTSYASIDHMKQIVLYGFFAVLTTLIFWGTELTFKNYFAFENSQYLGAFIGLALGYTIKFLLDKKYVFK